MVGFVMVAAPGVFRRPDLWARRPEDSRIVNPWPNSRIGVVHFFASPALSNNHVV